MFNKTHLEHAIIAIAIQVVVWLVFGLGLGIVSAWAAGAVAVAVFLGREIAQHEYKGGGPNEVTPFYGLLNHWSTDSVLDVVSPLVVCCVLPVMLIII